MGDFGILEKCKKYDPTDPHNGDRDRGELYTQLTLSLGLGVSAFIAFCILRPKWKSLYAARKKQSHAAIDLPELPDSLFGWIPVLYKVSEQDVLASAGLDAYVFLSFFRMSIKLFSVMFVITCIILAPINYHFDWLPTPGNSTDPRVPSTFLTYIGVEQEGWTFDAYVTGMKAKEIPKDTSYLWAYLVFTYVFTGLTIYFIRKHTLDVIKVRQDYLGSQSTVTDRTIKLSGIPMSLRSEGNIKAFLEKLQLGKVENVTVCRDWKSLDRLMDQRANVLRRLEEAWTVHLGRQRTKMLDPGHQTGNADAVQDGEEPDTREADNLLGQNHITANEQPRPTTRIWYGFMKLQNRKVDAIDYYEEKIRKLDDQIIEARKKEYKATPLAFVTMDSIPACQMAVQALLDPEPGHVLAKLAPAPHDIVWSNTYLPRANRMVRAWIITIFIFVLTFFWLFPVLILAGLLDLCSISQVWPQLANFLESHIILQSLVQTGLPTLVVSLLNVAVPFLYDYLANQQGMISQSDVELSVISKNFFFTFFNVFLVFTIFGSASKFWPVLQDTPNLSATKIAYTVATAVKGLGNFYTNFILLQSVGLLPFRLLEFGSVSLYPITLMGSKTPRDYAELVQPPVFKYGFYLPSAILVFILCLVYSILPAGYMILFFGVIYFVFGYYTYKYQLLYAMDHPQHATGGAWPMICYRIIIGMGVFQLVMAGLIALDKQFIAAGLVVPLIPFTIWYSYYFGRTYDPLTKYIALRSIRRDDNAGINIADEYIGINHPPGPGPIRRRQSSTIDESREKGLRFVNPSLVVPLEKMWIRERSESEVFIDESTPTDREESTTSSVSLGDTHIWRDTGDTNV